jgi:N4-gp56 family major capsid protein
MAVFPVGNLSSSSLIATANKVQMRKQALGVLEKSLHFASVCKPDAFERQNGKIVEVYRPVNFSDAALTPSTEGDVPTGLAYNNRTLRYAMGNYTDYVMFSTAEMDFSPTPDLRDAGQRLGYRGAKRVDDLTRQAMDVSYGTVAVSPLATYFVIKDCRNIRTRFKNASVPGQSKFGGMFPTIASPVVTYDLTNDPTSGGWTDINKFSRPNAKGVLSYPVMDDHLLDAANCYIIESNNVRTTTSSGGATEYWTYFFGDECFLASTLNVKAPPLTQPSPAKARFNVHLSTEGTPTKDDPTGEIGGFASYNIYFATGAIDEAAMWGGTARMAIMKHQSTVA